MAEKQSLLIEYQLTHNEVDRLNKQLWTTAQIIVPFSLTTFGIVATLTDHSLKNILTISIVAIISVLVLFGWFLMSKRWLSYQSIAQYRLIEIEKELDLWCTRYEIINNFSETFLSSTYTENELLELKARFGKIPPGLFPKGIKTSLILKRFLILISLSWLTLIAKELITISVEQPTPKTQITLGKRLDTLQKLKIINDTLKTR